jgi:type IV secretory pathway component VirB8
MSFFKNKKVNSAEEMQTWYNDRYISVSIQRNFLLAFSVVIACALFICLMVVKRLQDGKTATPYLVEYDQDSGFMTIVEAQSKKEYTAQEAVKESMLLQYIQKREAPKLSSLEEDMDYVRVMTSSKLYSEYSKSITGVVSELRKAGITAKYYIDVKDMIYLSANRVRFEITRVLKDDNNEILSSNDYSIVVSFGFADLTLPIEDMRINPLGFQITSYILTPVKKKQPKIQLNSNERDINDNNINSYNNG